MSANTRMCIASIASTSVTCKIDQHGFMLCIKNALSLNSGHNNFDIETETNLKIWNPDHHEIHLLLLYGSFCLYNCRQLCRIGEPGGEAEMRFESWSFSLSEVPWMFGSVWNTTDRSCGGVQGSGYWMRQQICGKICKRVSWLHRLPLLWPPPASMLTKLSDHSFVIE